MQNMKQINSETRERTKKPKKKINRYKRSKETKIGGGGREE